MKTISYVSLSSFFPPAARVSLTHDVMLGCRSYFQNRTVGDNVILHSIVTKKQLLLSIGYSGVDSAQTLFELLGTDNPEQLIDLES